MKLRDGVKKIFSFIIIAALIIAALPAVASTVTGTIESGVNSGGFDAEVPYRPTASVAAGTYASNQSVTLTSSGATSIRYTVDGTTPSCSSGTVYSTAVAISSSSTLKAIACKGDAASSVASFAYVLQCSTTSVANGSVAAYPGCAISCNSGYSLSGSSCVAASASTGGISGGGGGGSSTSSASGSLTTSGGSVTLTQSASSPSVKFTAPSGALSSSAMVTISKVYTSSSTYVPPAPTAGLFMVGGNVFQITAASGANQITNFSKPVTLTFTYTDAQIPAGVLEANLKIYYYDTVAKVWVAVASTVNPITNTVTAAVSHLTQFAIYGQKTAGVAAASADKLALIAQIQTLLNSLIAQLKTKVGEMIAKGEYVSPALMAFAPNATAAVAANPAGKITQGWAFGQNSEEIKIIQRILAKDAAIYPEGKITGYFGPATQAAVRKFQEKYGLAKPGDAGYGIVGPATRAKMNAM